MCVQRTILPTKLLIQTMYNEPYRSCIYNRHPEDEPSGSKHVEDIKKLKFKI